MFGKIPRPDAREFSGEGRCLNRASRSSMGKWCIALGEEFRLESEPEPDEGVMGKADTVAVCHIDGFASVVVEK